MEMLREMGSSERANVSRNLDAPQRWQMGRSSLSTGKLCTRTQKSTGEGPEGEGRANGTKVPSERVKLSTGNVPWSWRNGHCP
jgi:hypothetical protein